jgi:hypothetical protein
MKYALVALASAKRRIGYRDADRVRRTGARDFEIGEIGARSVSIDGHIAKPLPCG